MILDYNKNPLGDNELAMVGGTCLVDGVEIKQVFYADTDMGVVNSYDAFGDGKVHTVHDAVRMEGMYINSAGVYYKIVRGNVELHQRTPHTNANANNL